MRDKEATWPGKAVLAGQIWEVLYRWNQDLHMGGLKDHKNEKNEI